MRPPDRPLLTYQNRGGSCLRVAFQALFLLAVVSLVLFLLDNLGFNLRRPGIEFFLPEGIDTPNEVTRALVAITIFTSAYVAEIVRGGLQSVPRGQVEAAQALGLSTLKTTRLIVLPRHCAP